MLACAYICRSLSSARVKPTDGHVNILLLGEFGGGKTALLNLLRNLLHGKLKYSAGQGNGRSRRARLFVPLSCVSLVCAGAAIDRNHVTNHIEMHFTKNPSIRLYDSQGLQFTKSVKARALQVVMENELREGFCFEEKVSAAAAEHARVKKFQLETA